MNMFKAFDTWLEDAKVNRHFRAIALLVVLVSIFISVIFGVWFAFHLLGGWAFLLLLALAFLTALYCNIYEFIQKQEKI